MHNAAKTVHQMTCRNVVKVIEDYIVCWATYMTFD